MRLLALVPVALLYGVLPLAQTIVYLAGLPFADAPDTINYAASIIAYHWLLANVLFGLKLPVFQSTLPYDLRVRLHVWSTLGLAAFLAWHSVYTIFLMAKEIDVVSWTLLGLFAALVLLSILWIPLPGLKTVREKTRVGLRLAFLKSYDGLKAVHKLLYFVLAGLTYLHIVQAEIIALVPPVWGWAYHGLFVLTASAFVWTRIRNLTLPSLEVQSVTTQGGIVRLALAPHSRLSYRAGQFAFLRFDHPGLSGEEHPFSFTTAQHEAGVGFAIRALGDFTAKLPLLKPGDKVRINGGFGAFHPAAGSTPMALIGSGIGSVPLLSILKEVSRREPDREVVCLLSVNRRDELVEPEALTAIQARMPNLKLKIFIFEEDGLLYSEEVLARELPEPQKYEYYLCSSEKVRTIVVRILKSLGVRSGRIRFEAFSLG